MNWSNQKAFISLRCGVLALMRRFFFLYASIILSAMLIYMPAAHALGVGVAVTESYIGQPLSVRIPLYDVVSPKELSVRLLAVNGTQGRGELEVSIRRDPQGMAVFVSSLASVSEPYFQFTIEINDGGNIFSKEFTTLLNLAPNTIVNPASSSAAIDGEASRVSNPAEQVLITSQVMGPYDWAKAGQVPARFGPVLDGQSLWRVARRINKALGVSVHQMMWALYEQNPHAFATSSIESLSAGSYLNIPTYAQASALSHQQAADKLNQLSTSPQLADNEPGVETSVEPNVSSSTLLDQVEVDNSSASSEPTLSESVVSAGNEEVASTQEVAEDSFQLGGLDQPNDNSNSTQIISSLAETVGNLTQELIQKDQQIRFLEQKVSSLEDLVYSGGAVELADERESALAKEAELLARIDQPAAEVVEPAAPELESDLVSPSPESAEKTSSVPVWAWLVIALALLGALGVFFRERLLALYHSLNLFGSNDDIEFAATNYEGSEMIDPELYSLPHDMDSFMSFDEDETITIMVRDETADELKVLDDDVDQSNLSFNERFERLIAIKDYAFARELLDSSRGNEVDDQLYHRNRLRLYEAMHDEDAFYNYYDEIEPQLPEFDPAMQNKISQLVIRLAQY